MNKEELVSKLKSGVYNVTFTKVDGTERTMPVTLRQDLLPTRKEVVAESKKVNDNVLSAFCTDKNEWRSFRIANVIKLEEIA